jgi:CubicO group peptidase (beta-lactamase class C family)
MTRALFALGLSALALQGGWDGVGSIVCREEGERIDAYLTRLAAFGFSGAAVVAKGEDVLLAKGYGLADREKGIPVTVDTVFTVGSITKQFTAAAISKLESEGKLSVRDPISKHFPDVPEDKKGITLHHLLTHSSGLRSDFVETDFTPVGREEYVRRALASDLLFEPGSSYAYANSGYSLLGAVIEQVAGKSYEAYLREALFEPAGMSRTGYRIPAWRPEQIAQGYRGGEKWGTVLERPMAEDGPYWGLRANGGIHSTLADMLRWHRALEGDRVLPAAAKAKLFEPYVAEDPRGSSHYGYGWAIFRTRRGTKLVAHYGGNGIFAADFHRYVDEGGMFFVASNAEVSAIEISGKIAALLFDEEVPHPPQVANLEPAVLEAYAGEYRLPSGARISVVAEAGAIRLRAEGLEVQALLWGASHSDLERHRGLAAKTEAILGAASQGDFVPLQAALGGRIPLEEVAAMEGPMWERWRENLGRLQRIEAFGRTNRESSVTTTAKLSFEKGPRFVEYAWRGGEIVDVRAMRDAPVREVRPVSSREFVSFDPARSETWSVRFSLDAAARPEALLLGAETEEVTCPRVR